MNSLTARLTAAYLQGNPVATSELTGLIAVVRTALADAAKLDEPALVVPPAVPVKKSVTAKAILCLECGKGFSMLKRHLLTHHALTPEDYRTKWSLGADYPMTAPDYAAHRSHLARQIGLGKKKAPLPDVTEAPKARRQKQPLKWGSGA